MKIYDTKDIRNIAVCGVRGGGKTQLVESMLFSKKLINRLGKVEEGNTVSDYDPIEKERMSSIMSSLITFESGNTKFNFLDTPGYADFFGYAVGAMEVCESVLLVINPHEGIDITTKKIWKKAKALGKAVFIYVNFMDHEGKSFAEVVEDLKSKLSPNMAPVTAPIGSGEGFNGIINLLENTASEGDKEIPVPDDLKEQSSVYTESLLDSVASADDNLMEKYLEEGNLSPEDVKSGLLTGIVQGEIVPVLCGSAIKCLGMKEMLDFLMSYAPSPLDIKSSERKTEPGESFRALVFKIESQKHVGMINYLRLYGGSLKSGSQVLSLKNKKKQRINQIALKRGDENIIVDEVKCGDICALIKLDDVKINDTLAQSADVKPVQMIEFPPPVVDRGVYPKTKGDEEKIANAFSNIIDEDPTLDFGFVKETKEMVLKGIGTLQLELIVKKIKNRYEAEVDLVPTRIAYKETIRKKVDNVQGKYKKQTGGKGQYGDCVICMEPMERGSGFEFENKIVGGKIPATYIPSVEKGIVGAMEKGVIAGYPVVDFKVALIDGSYHDVDSSDLAFQIAGSLAFQNAMKDAQPYILEPIMKTKILVSNDYTGAVMGDLNSRRGRVLGMEPSGEEQIVLALVPKSSLASYTEDLRSMTSGEGEYVAEFDHYEEAPMDIQQKLIEKYRQEREEGR